MIKSQAVAPLHQGEAGPRRFAAGIAPGNVSQAKGLFLIFAGQDAVADAKPVLDGQPHQAMGAFGGDHLEMESAGP